MSDRPRCWCGSADLKVFSPNYLLCSDCRTLVATAMPGPEIARVEDEERDFYGRRYWFEYQEHELGNPDIVVRARSDLPGRCVYWLRTVLRYRLPPARALDVGCGHGAFVMLLRRAGFEASGLELSPWVVDFAQRTFQVPVRLGPLEAQALRPGTFDVITMMDVLEHLTDPAATLHAALSALGDDGLLVIQTPAVPPDLSWEEMVAANHRFLPLMAERGHLYLFNETSLRRLLAERMGLAHVRFEPAYFGAYDMFVVASRQPLASHNASAGAEALCTTPDGRLVQALLDLETRLADLHARYEDVERDRAARLAALLEHGERLGGAEGERNALSAELQNFREYLAVAEADRAARLAIIEDLSERLAASEQDRADRLALIQELSERLAASENDQADRLALIEQLSAQLMVAEADRVARVDTIEEQGRRSARLDERIQAIERERAAQADRLHELTAERGVLAAERDRRAALEAELLSLRFHKVRVVVRDVIRRLRRVSRG